MNALQYVIALITTLIVFGIGDSLYLPYAFQKYSDSLGETLRTSPALLPAVSVYTLTALGFVYFIVRPGINTGNVGIMLVNSALFGFLLFSFYAFTNLATLKDWPLFALVDIVYGTCIFALIGVVVYLAVTRLV